MECAVEAAYQLEFLGRGGFSATGEGGVFHGDLERESEKMWNCMEQWLR